MSTRPVDPAAAGLSLHHVGLVVDDMAGSIALYRRLGFLPSPPAYPALPSRDGASLRPVGAGNTHVTFPHNFVELTAIADTDEVGDDVRLVPLQAPADVLARLTESIEHTTTRLRSALARFQGLHILAFRTPDADATAAHLSANGVLHGGVNRLRRPVETEEGTQSVPVGYIEVDEAPGLAPEGRLAFAENLPPEALRMQRYMDHPNGAVGLAASILCVPAAELAGYQRRYETYLGRPARAEGRTRVFDLDDCRLVLLTEAELDAFLPGERAPAVPSFVAYAVTVRDTAATRSFLEGNGFPVERTRAGDPFVPATAALGAAVIFQSDD